MVKNATRYRVALSVVALLVLAAVAGAILYAACGGGTQTIRITALDSAGNPLAGIHARIVDGGSEAAVGQTGTDGTVRLSDPSLSGPVDISLGSAAYRNYTVAQVSSRDVQVTLNELERAAGYARITIDETTWGDLKDDIPNRIYRFAMVVSLFDDVTDILDKTECPESMRNDILVIPAFPGVESLVLPMHQGEFTLFAVAGLMDQNDDTLTLFKAGTASVAIDGAETCGAPKEVAIPLTQDLHEETAVTLSVAAPQPVGTEGPFQVLAPRVPGGTIGVIGLVLNAEIGAEKLGENSYRFEAFKESEIADGMKLSGQEYVTLSGFSNFEGNGQIIWSVNFQELPFSDAPQTLETGSLLPVPAGVSPAHDSVVALGDSLSLSWEEVAGADFYFVTLGELLVNGTVIDDRTIWQGMAPAGTAALDLPVAGDDMFAGVEACQVYRLNVRAFSKAGFDYDGGLYSQLYDLMIEDQPTLYSSYSTTFFTGGEGCGPLISIVWPFGGGEGEEVTITGRYFGDVQGASTLTFDNVPAAVTSWSDAKIVATSPAGAAGGEIVPVTVTVGGNESNSGFFQY